MIRLHHCYQSRSDRVLWLLEEMGIEFDLVVYPFGKPLREEPYRSINPMGRVPALEIDGRVMVESGAMIEVMCERFPEAGLGRLAGDAERIDWLQWVHFAETLSQMAANLTQQHILLYEDHMRSPTVMSLEAKRLAKAIRMVDDTLKGREYLLKSGFSAADVTVGQALDLATRFVDVAEMVEVDPWLMRLRARPAYAALTPPEGTALLYREPFYPAPEV